MISQLISSRLIQRDKWCYVTVVIDCCDRTLIGSRYSSSPAVNTVLFAATRIRISLMLQG